MATKERQESGQQRTAKQGASQSVPAQQGRSGGLQARRDNEVWSGPTRRDYFGSPIWSNPFSIVRRLSEDMDRLFGDVTGRGWLEPRFGRGSQLAQWAPDVEVFQRGNELVVRADVPGLHKDDLTIDVTDAALTIQGERRQEHEEEREGFYRNERSYGTFCRVIPLPEGTITDSAKATFQNGVLEIVMQAPSREVSRGRRVEIAESAQAQPRNFGAGSKSSE